MFFLQALEQFEIFTVYTFFFNNLYFNISNLFVYLSIILLINIFFIYFNINKSLIFDNNLILFFIEYLYTFLLDILVNQAGRKAVPFFSYIYTLFIFICFSNLIGVMPFSYTITSHIIVTFSIGFSVLLALTILGFSYQQLKFFNLIIPKNIPLWLLPLLVTIELVSYLFRGLSLGIRLFANIMSGHVLLHILTSFVFSLYKLSKLIAFMSLFVVIFVSSLELFLAVLQAYVFTVLTCIYLSDSLNEIDH